MLPNKHAKVNHPFALPEDETHSGQASAIPERGNIEERFKWRLEDIFPNVETWEETFKQAGEMTGGFTDFQGKLGESAENLLGCLRLRDELGMTLSRLLAFAYMRRDENTAKTSSQALADRITALYAQAGAATAWIVPEILSLSDETLQAFLKENEDLALYRFALEDIARSRPHILSTPEETLLAGMAEVGQVPDNVFSMLTNADMRFPTITDEKGNRVELTEERYGRLIRSQDRRVRRGAFMGIFETYGKFRNTLGATLGGSMKRDTFSSRARKYGSSLEGSLDSDNIPVEVYENTLNSVNANLDALHRYVALRKRVLGLDELHMYDLYCPLVGELERTIPYEEGLEQVRQGLAPLGEEYRNILEGGFREGWIDAFENRGKRSGAYSWGTYGVHPYVLLNYGGTIRDVFTIAHEMGHAIHRYYSDGTQPFVYSGHTIFVAEVASTTNESLLLRDLIEKAANKEEKLYLLNYSLEQIRTTVFRQTLFAEFEKITHGMAEAGEALTPDALCAVWRELNVRYYGTGIVVDPELEMEWARIPHFYNAFYVYQYATGYAAATSLSGQILREGKPAVDRYVGFLKKGSSEYSLDILRGAGVDMATPTPLEETIALFREHLAEMEELLGD